MKYIRTKDEISSVEPFTTPKGKTLYEVSGCENLISKDSLEEITIKEADTIEELCDEFTYEYDKNSKHERCWKDTNTGKWYDYDVDILLNEKEKSTIKGAIWTDKGLIYVAKMDNEGKLVLI